MDIIKPLKFKSKFKIIQERSILLKEIIFFYLYFIKNGPEYFSEKGSYNSIENYEKQKLTAGYIFVFVYQSIKN